MASYKDREAYIPFRRSDIIQLCVEDGKLTQEDAEKFREFCDLLSAYYHFRFHDFLERLKDNYAPFNPDASTHHSLRTLDPDELLMMEAQVIKDFQTILEKANFVPLSRESLQRAIEERTLIDLKTDLNFNEFDQILCYCQGEVYYETEVKRFKFFGKKTILVDMFSRVALLIKFRNKITLFKQKSDLDFNQFNSDKIYVYLYKNIPKYDLELLFPNLKISMTWKDRIILFLTAFGAAISVILKALPRLALIFGAILLFFFGSAEMVGIEISKEDVQDFMPVLVATLSLAITLGSFAFSQYSKYKSKKLEFRQNVTDTLFFKNLANNSSVFQALIDTAEEEECKEIILAYYHLLTCDTPLTAKELDNKIETWMEKKLQVKIDFNIEATLRDLETIKGTILKRDVDSIQPQEVYLLRKDDQGKCHILPLQEAKVLIDHIWDNLFVYG